MVGPASAAAPLVATPCVASLSGGPSSLGVSVSANQKPKVPKVPSMNGCAYQPLTRLEFGSLLNDPELLALVQDSAAEEQGALY